jgi:hypothetical protein
MCLMLSGVYTTTTFVLVLLYWRWSKTYAKNIVKMDDAASKIMVEHNAMAERLLSIQEAVNSHEFKLSGSHLHFQNKK